jgi:hypothetical protein
MKDIVDNVFESLEVGKKKLNAAQKEMLTKKFNYYSGGFNYASDEWGSLIIECNDDTFRNLEHYLGLEYERSNQEVLIRTSTKVIVSYESSERITEILKQLEALEKVLEV